MWILCPCLLSGILQQKFWYKMILLLGRCFPVTAMTLLHISPTAETARYINGRNTSACFLQKIFGAIGESLPNLVFQPLLKRKQVLGFLEEDVRYPKESLACLSCLLFVHHQAADTFPCVYRYDCVEYQDSSIPLL